MIILYKNVFDRVEKKYLLKTDKYDELIKLLSNYMVLDEYGSYTINNIYLDTDNFDLIRSSLEKPIYKEKMRLRSYNQTNLDSKVFLEIKKKYKGIVNKRRISLKLEDANKWIDSYYNGNSDSQISKEITYFMKLYQVKRKIFIAYDRTAYYNSEYDLRITFDTNIRSRETDLYLEAGNQGILYFKEPTYLMEIKCNGAMPLWLTQILSELCIYPQSFSKYGNFYKQKLLKEMECRNNV
ncbi:MAG: polyphosphate polymerase domain-containing protein [Bacilli bacterium]|nr:polyphosphate polymerase domain-containing protein [Bacilli bacterium]